MTSSQSVPAITNNKTGAIVQDAFQALGLPLARWRSHLKSNRSSRSELQRENGHERAY
jgi:hypothetical protein